LQGWQGGGAAGWRARPEAEARGLDQFLDLIRIEPLHSKSPAHRLLGAFDFWRCCLLAETAIDIHAPELLAEQAIAALLRHGHLRANETRRADLHRWKAGNFQNELASDGRRKLGAPPHGNDEAPETTDHAVGIVLVEIVDVEETGTLVRLQDDRQSIDDNTVVDRPIAGGFHRTAGVVGAVTGNIDDAALASEALGPELVRREVDGTG